QFVMGNIQNHFDGVGGPDKVTIALVVHGPALKAFHSASARPDLARSIEQFARSGVELSACGNTMRAQNVTLKNLLSGFVAAARGGVVRLARLQGEGYAYLGPCPPRYLAPEANDARLVTGPCGPWPRDDGCGDAVNPIRSRSRDRPYTRSPRRQPAQPGRR